MAQPRCQRYKGFECVFPLLQVSWGSRVGKSDVGGWWCLCVCVFVCVGSQGGNNATREKGRESV